MEQHPIPQNISSYEFRLVGDMTLKQFLQLAAGIVLGVIISRLPLIGIIKYPLVFLSVVLGITLAFVPINGRPFARYIWAFLMAIYSPTEFIWLKSSTASQPAQAIPTTPPQPAPAPVAETTPTPPSPEAITPPSPSTPEISHPVADQAPLSMDNNSNNTSTNNTQSETSYAKVILKPEVEKSDTNQILTNPTPTPAPTSIPSTDHQDIFTSGPQSTPAPAAPAQPAEATPTNPITPISTEPLTPKTEAVPTHLIVAPERPNILTGLVFDEKSDPIENVIIEIVEIGSGIPVRALRTNRLGQFQIGTPLLPGSYEIRPEKDGLTFEPVSVIVKDQIIDPILIKPQNPNA